MPSALATLPAAVRPLISGKVNADVQTTVGALRPHAKTRDALSEGGTGLGRADRLGQGSGQELAVDGLWHSAAVERACFRTCVAIPPRHGDAVGGPGRSPRPGPDRRAS